MPAKPIVLAITGGSGAVYAARLVQALLGSGRAVHLTISGSGAAVIRQELGIDIDVLTPDDSMTFQNMERFLEASDRLLGMDRRGGWVSTQAAMEAVSAGLLTVHHYKDYFTPIASGSFLTSGMVICPCSGSTLSGIAHAASQNLIQRTADVHLKEHRKLIVVPRETPLSVLQLENMHRLAQAGVIVLPASPGWYHGVQSLLDLVDFVVSRILDQLGIENAQIHRWEEDAAPATRQR